MRLKNANQEFLNKLCRLKYVVNPVLGGDPEFFVGDKDGKILPSDKFFPGKNKPYCLSFDKDRMWWSRAKDAKCNKLFFDGIQAEINPAPQYCREYLNYNYWALLKRAHSIIKSNKIVLEPSVRVLKKVLDEADPEARRFGCMPDFNAYTLGVNTQEMDASHHFYRYAGGHIHIGVSSGYLKTISKEYKLAYKEKNHLRIIKFLDVLVGIPSVIFDTGTAAKRRRTKYGLAGCFRPTPYGVEYRTPSCWWLKSPATTSLVYGFVRLAWNILLNDLDDEFRKHTGAEEEEVRRICDESDVRAAKKMWANIRPYLVVVGSKNSLSNCWNFIGMRANNKSYIDKEKKGYLIGALPAFDYLIKHGLSTLISNNVVKEWKLNNGGVSSAGFMQTMHEKLHKNKDFNKFQESYYRRTI